MISARLAQAPGNTARAIKHHQLGQYIGFLGRESIRNTCHSPVLRDNSGFQPIQDERKQLLFL